MKLWFLTTTSAQTGSYLKQKKQQYDDQHLALQSVFINLGNLLSDGHPGTAGTEIMPIA